MEWWGGPTEEASGEVADNSLKTKQSQEGQQRVVLGILRPLRLKIPIHKCWTAIQGNEYVHASRTCVCACMCKNVFMGM